MVWSGFSKLGNGLKTVGGNIANWYNANKGYGELPENANNANEIFTTGNKFKDLGIGLLAGLSGSVSGRQGDYFPQYNYVGNGLARSSIGFMNNPYYNSGSGNIGQLLAGLLRNTNRGKKLVPTTTVNNNVGGDFNQARIYRNTTPFSDGYYA